MTPPPAPFAPSAPFARSVGITNSRLDAAKRGVAVAVATRIACATDAAVCLVGADPTDHDVERHLPELVASWGEPARMQVTRRPHRVDVANFEHERMCVISLSDRESVELVLPALSERFDFIVVDAPSHAGSGIGIADVLLGWLDALLVATGLTAGDLAETRQYTEHLQSLPTTRHVEARVLTVGETGGGLAQGQLRARLASLPTIGHIPRVGANALAGDSADHDRLDAALLPVVRWIIDPAPAGAAEGRGNGRAEYAEAGSPRAARATRREPHLPRAPRSLAASDTASTVSPVTAKMTADAGSFRVAVLSIGFVGLAIRMVWIVAERHSPLLYDGNFYFALADAIRHGRGFIDPYVFDRTGRLSPTQTIRPRGPCSSRFPGYSDGTRCCPHRYSRALSEHSPSSSWVLPVRAAGGVRSA